MCVSVGVALYVGVVMMDCAVCGIPAYLLLVSSYVVPVPHQVLFLLAVEL